MDPIIARRTWRTVEPIHGMIYFSPEAAAGYEALGLTDRMGYFASRAAPMGTVPAEVVIATFFNFRPELVRASIPEAWNRATRDQILDARVQGADAALRRSLPDAITSPEMVEAAGARAPRGGGRVRTRRRPPALRRTRLTPLARRTPSRALARADPAAGVPRRRTHRGTRRRRASPASKPRSPTSQPARCRARCWSSTRAWPEDEWQAGVDGLRSRGLLEPTDELTLTERGRDQRQWIEDTTDAAAVVAYEQLGDDGCARLRALTRPWSRAIVDRACSDPDRLTGRSTSVTNREIVTVWTLEWHN